MSSASFNYHNDLANLLCGAFVRWGIDKKQKSEMKTKWFIRICLYFFIRQVTLFEELVLLKEYEKREDVLAEKVTNKQQEKLDMQAKVGPFLDFNRMIL